MDWKSFISAQFWNDPISILAGEDKPLICEGCEAAVIFKTSGSTGWSKFIVHEKRSLLLSAQAVNEWLGADRHSRWGLALPIDHMGGFAILARAYQAGCGMVRYENIWDPQGFTQWVTEESVTHTSLVPTQVHDLVGASQSPPETLRAVVVGGGRLSEHLGQAARDLGWPILASYGMTEAASQIATQPIGSLNQSFDSSLLQVLPIWNVSSDEDGRLILSGDALFKGYLVSEGGKMKFEPRLAVNFVTQDRVKISGDRLDVLGRMDELVKILGVLVDVGEVERRFLEISAGRISSEKFAVIAVPDERREHALMAVFEGEIPEPCLRAYQQVAPGLEQIAGCYRVDSFPRSSLGKVKRGELAKLLDPRDQR